MSKVLSPGEAMRIGDLLNSIATKAKITWVREDGQICKGELRCLIQSKDSFAQLPWGTDVRDAWVWITSGDFEYTESVERLVKLMDEGGFVTDNPR
ncbi:hypothetical protein HWB51_gp038 [Mycobacterium phage Cuke]|uniref:Uncharacterized protein n=1 Tax=Mycobacterium phage Cuke TaxID=2079417 RepID=A0A2L1IWV9_9CAUD|nr:hypothetical protein HWB51_gp038 [Mycobacterium phage Cuke]AVD99656.1 hypothetical protein SEA_CUKE_38 [Mycobacterium phage Cuke]